MIRTKRVYEPPQRSDGARVLVDRLWPRGVAKDRAKVDVWLKEIAPSDGLRKWFGHEPAKWAAFRREYRAELKEKSELLRMVRRLERERGSVTARRCRHADLRRLARPREAWVLTVPVEQPSTPATDFSGRSAT